MVRVWAEELGHGQWEWRGQVKHLMSGETRYFRDWSTLITFLEAALPLVFAHHFPPFPNLGWRPVEAIEDERSSDE
jgi:hypothetical protein